MSTEANSAINIHADLMQDRKSQRTCDKQVNDIISIII